MRSTLKLIALTAMSFFIFSACSPTEEAKPLDLEKARTEIQAMEDAYAAGENTKNADAVVAYYSDDAITYGRNVAPVSGKAAIKENIAQRLAADTSGTQTVYKVVDIFAEGDLLVEIGSWTRTTSTGEKAGNGHYMSVFKNKDGKYLCIRDMSADSNPIK